MIKVNWTDFFERIVSPIYQVGGLLVVMILVLLLSVVPFYRFVTLEPAPPIYSVSPKQIKEWGGNATEVTVGMNIINFPKFDAVNNDFAIDAILWFEFDSALVSLETIEKFSFEKGEIISKSISNTKMIDDKFFAQYNVTIKFTSTLAFQFFPWDDHRIYLTLTNKFVSPSEIIYESYISGFIISEGAFVSGWKMVGKNVVAGYSESYLDDNDPKKVVLNPCVLFSVDFSRSGAQHIFLILLPLFLMCFLGFFSFAFREPSLVFALSLGSVTAILSYSFVIQGMSPHTGYFLFSDLMFILFLGLATTCFLLNVLVLNGQHRSLWIVVRSVVYVVCLVTLVFVWYYLLYQWIAL
jgi:hypothetical protein